MRRLNGRIILRDKDINHVKIVVKKKKKKEDFFSSSNYSNSTV